MLPRAPPPPPPPAFLTAFYGALQLGLDKLVALPRSVGLALLALALVLTLSGRHGQRPLNAVVLGASTLAAALLGLPLLVGPGSWIPGVCAVVFTVLAVLFGFLADAWATGAVVGLFFAAAAALVCNELKLLWPPGFVLGFGFGLFAGRVNAAGLPLILPPLFSALFATAGAALLWAPHARGAQLAWLLEVDHALLACGACVAVLVGVSLEREHQRKRRLARRTKRAQDDELARQLAARTQRYQRAFEQAKDVEVAEDERPPRRR